MISRFLAIALVAAPVVPPQYPADPELSIFNQRKVTQEYPVQGLTFQYGINTDIVSKTEDAGTVTQANSSAVLQTTTSTTGSAVLQSRASVRYTPGQGVRMRFTAVFSECKASSNQEVGVGDASNGLFFGCVGARFGIIHRNAGVETFVPYEEWNGFKPTFDKTKGNVYSIAYQWLGYGVIRFQMERPNGTFVLVHQINYPNSASAPSLGNPIMKFWARVINYGNNTNLTLKVPSVGIVSEGPTEIRSVTRGLGVRKHITAAAGFTNIVTLKNAATFNSQTNMVRARLLSIHVSGTGTSDLTCKIVRNGVFNTGSTFQDISTNLSLISYDLDAGVLDAGFGLGGNQYAFVLEGNTGGAHIQVPALEIYIEPGETASVVCKSESGNPDVGVGINWGEEF